MQSLLFFGFVEWALASANIDAEKLNGLSDFSNITPKTSAQRILFIFSGLVAGYPEGFKSINRERSSKKGKWERLILELSFKNNCTYDKLVYT